MQPERASDGATRAGPNRSPAASGNGNQTGEMTVLVAEFEGLDAAGAGGHGIIERMRHAGRKDRNPCGLSGATCGFALQDTYTASEPPRRSRLQNHSRPYPRGTSVSSPNTL